MSIPGHQFSKKIKLQASGGRFTVDIALDTDDAEPRHKRDVRACRDGTVGCERHALARGRRHARVALLGPPGLWPAVMLRCPATAALDDVARASALRLFAGAGRSVHLQGGVGREWERCVARRT